MVKEYIGKIPTRREDSHKGDYGRVLVVAGSRGLTGAAYMCAQAAIRSGSGLVTAAVPESLNAVMETKLTECMTLSLEETADISLSLKAKQKILAVAGKCDCLALGPGLGDNAETRRLACELLEEVEKPVVLDADGINALEGSVDVLKKRQHSTVITPHPGEMARLVGKDAEAIQSDRQEAAKTLAASTNTVVCLKGHKTIVASSDGMVYVNETGNSGMATGGTGDVLTGMIASFIGQGIDEFSATVSAVYLHGISGDIAADKKGPFCMIATDLIDYLPEAFDKAGI
ncbi:MAG: NAD(P)H-hydrate dehydratase [Candidatus Tantalella remota]|nr:NAD(P)H-hydrate dehydratase [Candidatus Tantalella remota]